MGLYPWQEPSAQRLVEIFQAGNVGICAHLTGAGKTYIAVDVLRRLNRQAVVLAPKSALSIWPRVAGELGLSDRIITTTNPEQVRLQHTPYFKQGVWRLPPGAMLVWDEVHRGASGKDSQQTEMLARLKVYNIPLLALSATIADSPLKLRGLGFLLGLHEYNQASYFRWCFANGCFTVPHQKGLRFGKGPSAIQHMHAIHEQIKDRMVRLRLEDIPDFPECETQATLYDLSKRDTDEINEIYAEMAHALKQPHANILVEIGRARQRVELFKVPLLVELTNDLVEEGKSVVIFINYRETLERLAKELKQHNVATIHGSQTATRRDDEVQAFQRNDCKVCVAMTQAGGLSISLHDVRHERPRVSLITPSYSASDIQQVLGRIHRAGGTKALQIFVLAAGTIEERIHAALRGKLHNIASLNDGLTDADLQGIV